MNLQTASRVFSTIFIICTTFLTRPALAGLVDPPPRPIPPRATGCPGPTATGVLLCYRSTACRGGVLLPDDTGDRFVSLASPEECCGGQGLSFCDERGCRDCFSEEAYSSSGTEFYFGFFNNLRFPGRLSQANLRVQITADDINPAAVRVSYRNGEEVVNAVVEPGDTESVEIDSDLIPTGIGDRDGAVFVQSVNGQGISVAGLSEEITSSDSFCIFPRVFLPSATYEYYAVSVPRSQILFFSDGVQELIDPEENSAFLIVTTADSTQITFTLTQSVSTEGADDLTQFGPTIEMGEVITLTLDAGQTLYVSSIDDLTGSCVVTDKPITFLSGHECGAIPRTNQYCDQMIEQIPATATWGFQFFTAPFLTRGGGDAVIILTSADNTVINVVCNNPILENGLRVDTIVLTSTGDSVFFNTTSFEYCSFTSNQPVIVNQFSLASQTDGNEAADPFMVLIPPRRQYRHSLSFRIFETITAVNKSQFINIFLPAEFNRFEVRLNGDPLPEGIIWEPILCGIDAPACAYAAQVLISSETQTVTHVNPAASLAVVVYSLGFRTGQGQSAGQMQRPIALDEVTLSAPEYSVQESAGELLVTLEREGRLLEPISVLLRSRTTIDDNAAQVGEDFIEVSEVVDFAPDQSVATVMVRLSRDDVFPEPNKTFELFLGPTEGVYITPYAAATVTIINDDPDIPIVEVRIDDVFSFVVEGDGVLEVPLVKSEGAVGRVAVHLFTRNDTAFAGFDYSPLDVIVTFEVDETTKTEQLLIFDDPFLEEIEFFNISIEAINNIDDGFFPVITRNDHVAIAIIDNDLVVIGFSPVPCRTSEGVEGLNVQVDILVGLLARNVSVLFETTSGTAIGGEDFTAVSRTLVFSGARRGRNRFSVFVGITDDAILEDTESFHVNLSLSGGEEEEGIRLVHPQADVFIEDDDIASISLILTPQVPEGGVAMATVAAGEGQLGREVRVRLSTINGNATGGVDFEQLTNVELVLNSQSPSQSVPIQIFDNIVFDGNKVFSVVAELITIGRVGINPSVAMIAIIDDEVAPQVQCFLSEEDCVERNDTFFQLSSLRDCCVLIQAESFSFPEDESGLCHQCIVIGFDRSGFSFLERNQSYSLRVRVRSGFLPQSITLALVTTAGSASPADYSIPNTITLLPNPEGPASTDILIDLPRELVNTDSDFESFRIDIVDSFGTAPSNMFFEGTVITIIDFEPVIQFSQTAYTVSENQQVYTVEINISPPSDEPVTIVLRVTSGTAVVGSDVGPFEGQFITVQADNDQTLVMVSSVVVDDDIFEAVETFSVEIDSVSTGVIGDQSTAVVTLLDNDLVTINATGLSGQEGGVATVEVSREGSSEVPIIVNFATEFFESATPSEDFGPIPVSLTIAPDQSSIVFTIPLIDDAISEARESFGVRVTASNTRVIISFPGIVALFIDDNDVATVVFSQPEFSVSEAEGSVAVGVALTPETTLAPNLAINISISAIVGSVPVPIGSIELLNEVRSGEVIIPIEDDEFADRDRTFTVFADLVPHQTLSSPQLVVTPSQTTVTVLDDDTIILGFNQTSITVFEDSDFVMAEIVVFDGQTRSGMLLTVLPVPLTAQGGDVDYRDINPSIFFSGQSVPIAVAIISDDILESDETFQLRLDSSDGPAVFQSDTVTITLVNDDEAFIGFRGGPTFDGTFYNVFENDGSFEVNIGVVQGQLGRDVAVVLTTNTGSATEGIDYVPINDTLIFNGQTPNRNVTITVINDDIAEDSEIFTLQLNLVSEINGVVLSPANGFVRIEDTDRPALAVVGLERTLYQVSEDVGVVEVCAVVISPVNGCPIAFSFEVILSTGDESAVAPMDYRSVVVILAFEACQIRRCINVSIVDDVVLEDTELLNIFLLRTVDLDSRITLNPVEGVIEISDNDETFIGFRGGPTFDGTFYNVFENDGSFEVNIGVVQGQLGRDVAVVLTTNTGSATEGIDYVPINDTLTFNGQTPNRNVTITIINDDIAEDSEIFTLQLNLVSEINVVLSPANGFVRIEDTDRPEPVMLSFERLEYNVTEGDRARLTVVLSNADDPTTVRIETVDGTALVGLDYEDPSEDFFRSEQESFSQTVSVLTIDDELAENTEFLTVRIVPDDDGVTQVDPERGTATLFIVDNDDVTIGFSQDSYSVFEGFDEALEATVRVRNGQLGQDLFLVVSTLTVDGEDAATGEEDFLPVSQVVVLNSTITSATVFIPINDDEEVENFEFFGLLLSVSPLSDGDDVAFLLSPRRVPVEISDNDFRQEFQVGFQNSSVTVTEFIEVVDLILNATGSIPLDTTVTVQFSFTGETATIGSDVIFVDTNITMDPETFIGRLRFSVINDGIYEAEEEFFTVRITEVSTGSIDPNRQEVTVTIIDESRLMVGGFIPLPTRENETEVVLEFFVEGEHAVPVSIFVSTIVNDAFLFPALPGEDYEGVENVRVVFEPGVSQMQLPLSLISDDRTEPSREIGLFSISTELLRIDINVEEFFFEIIDDDFVEIRFSQTTYSVSEGAGALEVTVFVSDGVLGVDYSVGIFAREFEGGAVAPIDYTLADISPTLDSEITQVSFNITITDDAILEETESFVLGLEEFSDFDIDVRFPEEALIVIEDDDQISPLRIGFLTQSLTVREVDREPSFLTLGVLDGILDSVVTVTVQFVSGTADLPIVNVTLEPGNGTLAELEIQAIFDEIYEEDEEALAVQILSVTEGIIDPESQEAIVTIVDGDMLFIRVGQISVGEGSGEPPFITLSVSGFSDVPVQLLATSEFLFLSNETERQATPDVDFAPLNQSLFLEPGQFELSAALLLIPVNDNFTEGPEVVNIRYAAVGRSRIQISVNSPAFTIIDDDTTVIGFEQTAIQTAEGIGVLLTVQILRGAFDSDLIFSVNVATDELIDQPNVATAGEDFTSVQESITFSSSVTSRVVSVLILLDEDIEPPERFEVRLSRSDESQLLVTLEPDVATVTINDSNLQ